MATPSTLQALQQRMSEMQPLRLDERLLPTPPLLVPLFPRGGIRAGASYTVYGSPLIPFSALSTASEAGNWCAIIGFPHFGAESAARLGLALDRCIMIPEPGKHLFGLVASLSEIASIVLVQAPHAPQPRDAERIAAKLRDHGSSLLVTGQWPRVESTFRVISTRWEGLGRGNGQLDSCSLRVETSDVRGVRLHSLTFTAGILTETPTSLTSDRPVGRSSTAPASGPRLTPVLPFRAPVSA